MPIEKVTAAEFASAIQAEVERRDNTLEVTYGPIFAHSVWPQAVVLESQNDRARKVSFLLSLSDPDQFDGYEVDLEARVLDEGVTRSQGTRSTVTLVFSTAARPVTDLVVALGEPLATAPDASTGETVRFVVTETTTLVAANASSYFNVQTQRYELRVPAQSVGTGAATLVGPNRVTRTLRPLSGFSSVTNAAAASGGLDAETNAQLIERFFLGVNGRQEGTPGGLDRALGVVMPGTLGRTLVYGASAVDEGLLERAEPGAVDVWVRGASLGQATETYPYLGRGQLIAVALPPLVSIVSVTSGATTFIEGTDFVVALDDGGYAGSTSAVDGIRFTADGAVPAAVGDLVSVTYSYNALVRAGQSDMSTEDTFIFGRDLMVHQAFDVPVVVTGRLRVKSGYVASNVLTAVRSAILTHVNTLAPGLPLEESDIQQVVRAVSGVDNYITTRLTRATVSAGTTDVAFSAQENPSLDPAALTVGLF